MNEEYINSVSERYIELYENITGNSFTKADVSDITSRIQGNVISYLEK